jgi:hypothetical protein
MPFPRILHCLICEEVRPERNNLSSILGFYGVAPDVEILLRDLNQPMIRIAFLMLCAAGGEAGEYRVSIQILDPAGNRILESPEIRTVITDPNRRYNLGISVQTIAFRNPGTYSFNFLVNGEAHYSTTFQLRQGGPQDFPSISSPLSP